MAFTFTSKKGKKVTLLNPSEKGGKYARELKNNVHVTNDGKTKLNDDGSAKPLTKAAKAYRSGYLQSRKDSANAYKAKKKKK